MQIKESGQVSTSWTTIGNEIRLNGKRASLGCQLSSAAGGSTLTGFRMQVKTHPDAPWHTYLEDADFGAGGVAYYQSSTTPHDLAAEGESAFWVASMNAYAVRFQAKVASSTATLTLYGSGE